MSRCEHLCDTVIQLKSLANEGNSAYNDYDGLLILKKLPIINTWNSTIPESNDWAFKIKKKHFVVEVSFIFHLRICFIKETHAD